MSVQPSNVLAYAIYACDHTDEVKRRRTHSKDSICDFVSSGIGAPTVRAPELDRIRLFTFKEKKHSANHIVSHELLPNFVALVSYIGSLGP
jgi:hypothetical protein